MSLRRTISSRIQFDGRAGDTYFTVGTAHGVGKPHYYVCLDENGGERSWWLDPEQAEALGRILVECGSLCRRLNAEAEEHTRRPGENVERE